MGPSDELYLGDGLYASFDGWSIKLRAPREGGDHVVYLEADLYQALTAYAARCWRRDGESDGESPSRFPNYDNAQTDPHHGGKIWEDDGDIGAGPMARDPDLSDYKPKPST